jgi:hypothetical protein
VPRLPEIKFISDHEEYKYALQIGERTIGLVGHPIGDPLFIEALQFSKINFDKVGIHTSFRVHKPEAGFEFISIHFRRNLDSVKARFSTQVAREFIGNLRGDLKDLAGRLNTDPVLEKVKMIYGLTSLSAKWGSRHGFQTEHYTSNPALLAIHEASLPVEISSVEESKLPPLHLFSYEVKKFIDRYLQGSP